MRATIGARIDAGAALDEATLETLSNFRGHLMEAWSRVRVFVASHHVSTELRDELAKVETLFFTEYQKLREEIHDAGAAGAAYPVTSREWIAQSSHAIDELLELAHIAGNETLSVARTEARNGTVSMGVA